MSILSRILGKIYVLSAIFTDAGGVSFSLASYSLNRGKILAGEKKAVEDIAILAANISKAPVLLAISGKGVITKEVTGDVADKVISAPETFLYTISEGKISFVRRGQLTTPEESLKIAGITPLYTECVSSVDEVSLAAVAERFFSQHLGWKEMLKPSEEGSRLASLVAGRLVLPVSGVLLLVLVANFAISSRVETGFREANATLAALRKTSSADAETNEHRQAAIEDFSRRLPYSAARLSDMVAAVIPERIVFSELGVAPVTKAPENGKPLAQNENILVMRGETDASETITELTSALSELRLGTISLTSVEQSREREALIFTIELAF